MLPIAIQNGRHSSLPPLLLPDVFRTVPSYDPFLRSKRQFSNMEAGADFGAAPPIRTILSPDGSFTSLDSLASLATKRRKLNLTPAVISHAFATVPDATGDGSTAYNDIPAVPSPPSSAGSITPHGKVSQVSIPHNIGTAIEANPNLVVAGVGGHTTGSGGGGGGVRSHGMGDMRSKRQRIGPSCDSCRLKKIKCNASIEILYQDESVVALGSDSLHVRLTREDCKSLPSRVREAIPHSILEHVTSDAARDSDLSLVKHVDKLVAFRPCTSCTKRAGSGIAACTECQFSKGLTRADINVFTRLERQLGPREKLASFSVGDYRLVGY